MKLKLKSLEFSLEATIIIKISFRLVIRLGDGFMVDYESNDEDQHDKDEVTVAQDQINLFHFDGSSTFVSFN